MSDDEIERVIDELDPQPITATDVPVSRRQALRGLASVGALATVGDVRAQDAAGTVIADEAYFSNYGSEATAEGYDLTLDGDTYSFDGSEEIGLPGGGVGTEVVTPSGATGSEIVGPSGQVLWQANAIPDSGLDHLWWGPSISDISTYPDEEGALDMPSVGGPSLSSINSRQAGGYDGADDAHQVGQSLSLGGSGQYTFVAVYELSDDGTKQTPFSMGRDADSGFEFGLEFDNSQYRFHHPSVDIIQAGTPSTSPEIAVGTFDGSTAILDINGTEVINAAMAAMNAPEPYTDIARGGDGVNWSNGAIGAAGWEATAADAARRDELTNIMSDEFNISVST